MNKVHFLKYEKMYYALLAFVILFLSAAPLVCLLLCEEYIVQYVGMLGIYTLSLFLAVFVCRQFMCLVDEWFSHEHCRLEKGKLGCSLVRVFYGFLEDWWSYIPIMPPILGFYIICNSIYCWHKERVAGKELARLLTVIKNRN